MWVHVHPLSMVCWHHTSVCPCSCILQEAMCVSLQPYAQIAPLNMCSHSVPVRVQVDGVGGVSRLQTPPPPPSLQITWLNPTDGQYSLQWDFSMCTPAPAGNLATTVTLHTGHGCHTVCTVVCVTSTLTPAFGARIAPIAVCLADADVMKTMNRACSEALPTVQQEVCRQLVLVSL